MAASTFSRINAGLAPIFCSSGGTNPPSWSRRARSRCSGSMALPFRPEANCWAADIASWDLVVNFSDRIIGVLPVRSSHTEERIGTSGGEVKTGEGNSFCEFMIISINQKRRLARKSFSRLLTQKPARSGLLYIMMLKARHYFFPEPLQIWQGTSILS